MNWIYYYFYEKVFFFYFLHLQTVTQTTTHKYREWEKDRVCANALNTKIWQKNTHTEDQRKFCMHIYQRREKREKEIWFFSITVKVNYWLFCKFFILFFVSFTFTQFIIIIFQIIFHFISLFFSLSFFVCICVRPRRRHSRRLKSNLIIYLK